MEWRVAGESLQHTTHPERRRPAAAPALGGAAPPFSEATQTEHQSGQGHQTQAQQPEEKQAAT
jgi:hypothetical protein